MGLRLKNAALMYGISKINILMMDYRGFGSSQGVPTENGIVLDARAVVKYLKSHPKSNLINYDLYNININLSQYL